MHVHLTSLEMDVAIFLAWTLIELVMKAYSNLLVEVVDLCTCMYNHQLVLMITIDQNFQKALKDGNSISQMVFGC